MDRVEIVNSETGENTVFPCNKWLSKSKEDGEIGRDLYPLMPERDLRRKEANSRRNESFNDDDFERNNKRRGAAYDDFDQQFEKNPGRRDRWRNEY